MHTARKRKGKRKRKMKNSKNIFAVASSLISVNRPQSGAGVSVLVDDG